MSFDFQIIGAGRGGTSLLAGVVDAHPDCSVVFEAFSIPLLMGRTWTDAESIRSPSEQIRARVGNFLQGCEAESTRSPTKIWGHKTTTEQIRGLRLLSPESEFAGDPEMIRAAEEFDSSTSSCK